MERIGVTVVTTLKRLGAWLYSVAFSRWPHAGSVSQPTDIKPLVLTDAPSLDDIR